MFRPFAILGAIILVGACGTGASPDKSPTPVTAIESTATTTPSVMALSSGAELPIAAPTPFPAPSDFSPDAIAIGPDGALYASSCGAARVYRLVDAHDLVVVIGSGGSGFDTGFVGDGGPATEAQVSCPVGLAFDPVGRLVLADHGNNRIRRVDAAGTILTIAGSGEAGTNRGSYGGDGGPATSGFLQEPTQIAFGADGDLFISDRDNNRVRKVDTKGILTTVAGDGTDGFGGDGGPAATSPVDDPAGIAVASDGTVYVADSNNGRIRRIDPAGNISTIAGTGAGGTTGDGGPASKATFEDPEGLAIDLPATSMSPTRQPTASGGSMPTKSSRPSPAPVKPAPRVTAGRRPDATLNGPSTVAIDGGDVYIADQGNARIRKVTPDGIITTVFGGS